MYPIQLRTLWSVRCHRKGGRKTTRGHRGYIQPARPFLTALSLSRGGCPRPRRKNVVGGGHSGMQKNERDSCVARLAPDFADTAIR